VRWPGTRRETGVADPSALTNRVLKNQRHLGKWARREGIEAFRIYDRDIPEFPLAIDRYGDWLHLQVFEKKRPLEPEDLHVICQALAEVLDLSARRVVVKHRRRQRGLGQYQRLADESSGFTVKERDLRFEVNLAAYLDTGLFLDHRDTRQMIRERSRDRTFLNLFAYTGSFTVYAAAGGARNSLTVDMSHTYQDWSRRNLALNGFDDPARHRFAQADVVSLLESMHNGQERFDLIVLDPPSFSNSKRMDSTFDIQRDQLGLLRATLGLLTPGGELFFSNNRQGFRLDPGIGQTASVEEITQGTIPVDFKRHTPHRCWILRTS
jgi:23S rRNA (cytosine1962-C5)-methyltransferase